MMLVLMEISVYLYFWVDKFSLTALKIPTSEVKELAVLSLQTAIGTLIAEGEVKGLRRQICH